MEPIPSPSSGMRRLVLAAAVTLVVVAGVALLVDTEPSPAPIEVPQDQYDPVAAGEPLPQGYRIGLARDQIEPVYEPVFTTAAGVDWPDDSLVIGVAGEEEAKAYPVTHLNSHEMVVDSLAGIPILVTW